MSFQDVSSVNPLYLNNGTETAEVTGRVELYDNGNAYWIHLVPCSLVVGNTLTLSSLDGSANPYDIVSFVIVYSRSVGDGGAYWETWTPPPTYWYCQSGGSLATSLASGGVTENADGSGAVCAGIAPGDRLDNNGLAITVDCDLGSGTFILAGTSGSFDITASQSGKIVPGANTTIASGVCVASLGAVGAGVALVVAGGASIGDLSGMSIGTGGTFRYAGKAIYLAQSAGGNLTVGLTRDGLPAGNVVLSANATLAVSGNHTLLAGSSITFNGNSLASGNYAAPPAANVYGNYGAGNATHGTLTLPAANRVDSAAGAYGLGGNSITPTLDLANVAAGNIRSGLVIAGVTGNYTGSGAGNGTLNTDTINAIADAVLSRSVSHVEATADSHSLCFMVLAVSDSSTQANAGNLTVYRTDGQTEFARRSVVSDASAAPIVAIRP